MKIKDKKHAQLMNDFIKYADYADEEGYRKRLFLDNEVPYNYHGSRGFIDVIYVDGFEGDYCIVELEATIEDLGETIRQVKKAQEYFLKTQEGKKIVEKGRGFSNKNSKKQFLDRFNYLLVLPLIEEFITFVKENEQTLRNIRVAFFTYNPRCNGLYILVGLHCFKGEDALKKTKEGYIDAVGTLFPYYKFITKNLENQLYLIQRESASES